MRIRLSSILYILPLVFATITKAAEEKVVRCATDEYMKARMVADPALRGQRQRDEVMLQDYMARMEASKLSSSQSIVTIPVVVHVVYRLSAQNITDAQIQSQIDVLNEDFARLNADTVNTPAPFKPLARGTNFRFCLAQQDTIGNATNGIERRYTTVSSFSTNNAVKFYSSGGLNAWDPDRFLNIWVCNLGGGILGYGEFPTSSPSTTFGLVVKYNAFGRTGTLMSTYDLGRTTVHEISHCFGLYHIWGDDNGTCAGSDLCTDTPNQADMNYGCRTFPTYDSCSPDSTNPNGIMFMNYMDYSDDICLNMFTYRQSLRMTSAMNLYYPTLLTSTACQPVLTGIQEPGVSFLPSVYPNPSAGIFNIDFFTTVSDGKDVQLTVTDLSGRTVVARTYGSPAGSIQQVDLSDKPEGVYFFQLQCGSVLRTYRVALVR
ncbi:MAG: M43 family zinc metalloprotease [Bacteroidota bacterium]